jgi:hypothetical protein
LVPRRYGVPERVVLGLIGQDEPGKGAGLVQDFNAAEFPAASDEAIVQGGVELLTGWTTWTWWTASTVVDRWLGTLSALGADAIKALAETAGSTKSCRSRGIWGLHDL